LDPTSDYSFREWGGPQRATLSIYITTSGRSGEDGILLEYLNDLERLYDKFIECMRADIQVIILDGSEETTVITEKMELALGALNG
jgi:hypothetical protein